MGDTRTQEAVGFQPKKRICYIDMAKGFAMLCIIAGHFAIPTVDGFVYTFHVPLFFLASGYFLSTKRSLKETAKTKGKQLFVPYVVTGLSYIPISAIVNLAMGSDTGFIAENSIRSFIAIFYGSGINVTDPVNIKLIGLLWFLPALFFGLLIARFSLTRKHPLIIVSAAAIVGWASGQMIWLPMSIQPGCVASLFIYLGFLARQNGIFERKPNVVLVIGALALWVFCISQGIICSIVSVSFDWYILSALDAVGASYLIVLACKWCEDHFRVLARFLNYCGQNTLSMMCFHGVSDYAFPNFPLMALLESIGAPHFVSGALVILLNWGWSILGITIVKHVPILRKIYSYKEPVALPPKRQ